MMDLLLHIIIAIVVVGVGLYVLKFCLRKWFPEFMEYYQVLLAVAMAALFIYILVQVWPFLTGAAGGTMRHQG